MYTTKQIATARRHIERESELAYDVASEVGQIFSNVKHMSWFLKAVLVELYGER